MIDKQDIKILDSILDTIINTNSMISYKSFQEHEYFKNYNSEERKHEFQRLIDYFVKYNCAKIIIKGYHNCLDKNQNTQFFKESGGFNKIYQDELNETNKVESNEKLKTRNLELQNENLEFLQTIREKETEIRNLEFKIKKIELLKQYWWFIGLCIFAGGILKELLDLLQL